MSVKDEKFNMAVVLAVTKEYERQRIVMREHYEMLMNRRAAFPEKRIEGLDYENLVLLAASAKHEANTLVEQCTTLANLTEVDHEYFEAKVLIYMADDLLKDLGFDDSTAVLRTAATTSSLQLSNLRKEKVMLFALRDSAVRLFRTFESDEVNFRQFYKGNEIRGF